MMPTAHSGFSAKLLEPGDRFLWNGKRGSVIEHRPDGYVIHWKSHHCPDRKETIPAQVKLHDWDEIACADAVGLLQVELKGTMAKHAAIPRYDRSKDEERRMQWRLSYVKAAEGLITSGEMLNRRSHFVAKFPQIQMLGSRRFDNWRRKDTTEERKRGGAVQDLGPSIAPPESRAHLHALYNAYLKNGTKALYDGFRRSGWRGSHLSAEEEALIEEVVQSKLDGERPSIGSIVESFQAAFYVHNKSIDPILSDKRALRIPGYEAVRAVIERMAPIDHAIRRQGKAKAYRDLHALGVGVETSRALERVEVAEYTLDVMTLREQTGVLEILPEELIAGIELTGKAARLTCSAASDVHTRAILAMKFATSATADLFAETVELICSPKDAVFDGITQMDWPMYGRPETIVVDRGPAYTADASYDLLADLGIVNQGAAAKKPG